MVMCEDHNHANCPERFVRVGMQDVQMLMRAEWEGFITLFHKWFDMRSLKSGLKLAGRGGGACWSADVPTLTGWRLSVGRHNDDPQAHPLQAVCPQRIMVSGKSTYQAEDAASAPTVCAG